MSASSGLRVGLLKALFYSLLSFFLLPGLAYIFTCHVQSTNDAAYVTAVQQNVDADRRLSVSQKEAFKTYVRAHPPSVACASTDVTDKSYKDQVCAPYDVVWQFYVAGLVSWWTIVVGAGVFAAIFVLGGAAFLNHRAPHISFLWGWRLLVAASTLEVIVQGGLAVWLSYWLTAFFFQVYIVKLILFVAILAVMAAAYALGWIFKKAPLHNRIEGEVLTEQAEPKLWARVRALAQQVKTAPPDHIVAGIDTNFFVTQIPLTVSGQELRGRILFVSLPILRLFDQGEADAVLAHELAHFHGGDTKWSAILGPRLAQFDHYCAVMQVKNVFIAFHILRLYRLIFEFALQRGSRLREILADRTAAQIVSAQDLIHALIKFSAYAGYRKQIESELFAHNQKLEGSLSIADQVQSGLTPYATSAQFIDQMRFAHVPHPFDSHPSLIERMKNVDYFVDETSYAAIATAASARTWAEDISSIDAVEAKLWNKYEQAFSDQHEKSLAFRYRPSTAEEEAIVLKYFPPMRFVLKRDKQLIVTYQGVILPDHDSERAPNGFLSWDQVTGITIKSSNFGADKLMISHPKTGVFASSTSVSLAGIGKHMEPLKDVLGFYWHRHKVSRNLA